MVGISSSRNPSVGVLVAQRDCGEAAAAMPSSPTMVVNWNSHSVSGSSFKPELYQCLQDVGRFPIVSPGVTFCIKIERRENAYDVGSPRSIGEAHRILR